MKKSFLLCTMLFAACFVNGAEYLFDTQASCEAEGKTKLGFKDGHHVLKGNCHFWTTQMFKHDPAKKYKISAEVMTESQQPYPSFVFGLVFFNEKGRFIYTKEYVTASNGFTELAKPMEPSDTVITIKKPAGFKKHRHWHYVLAFEAKEDNTDLPNAKVTTRIKKMEIGADTITLTLSKPTFASYPAGTKVRLHYDLSFFLPVDLNTYYTRPNAQWKTIGGAINIPYGVKNFKPAFIYYHRNSEKSVYIRNFKLIEE